MTSLAETGTEGGRELQMLLAANWLECCHYVTRTRILELYDG